MKYLPLKILAPAILFASCAGKQHPVDLSSPKKTVTKNEFSIVAIHPLTGSIRLPGQLKPFESVNIYAKVNGFVKELFADRGSHVHKGQILARLEAPEMGGQLQTATSKYVQVQEAAAASRERYDRLKDAAREPGAVAQLDLDNALSRMKADEAAVRSEKASLSSVSSVNDYLTITAPFDGVITQRNVSDGALVGSGRAGDLPMFVLEQSAKLRMEVMIPEAYSDNVDLKHEVTFTLNALPGKAFSGKVSRSADALGNMRSEALEIDVPNPHLELKPGMYAEVTMPLLSATQSIIVPSSAIVRSTERMYVILAQNGKAHLETVREGMKTGELIEVFGNLPEGARVLEHATDEIKEGDMLN